jgi:hypothetical protein
MKKKIIGALLAVGATFSAAAFAGSYITNWGVITQIESYGDDFHVYGLNLAPNPAGCSSTSLAKVDYRLSAAKKEGLSRTLTSAYLAGRQVKVKLQSDYCEGTNPAVYGVWVQ